jgi:hypothetical protein
MSSGQQSARQQNSKISESESYSDISLLGSDGIGHKAKNSLERIRQNLQKPRRLESDTSSDSLASRSGNQNNANDVSSDPFAGVGPLKSNNNSDSLRSNSSSVPPAPLPMQSNNNSDIASHTGNQNNANNVSTAAYNIKKQSAVRNIINKFDNITRTSPENDLYRLLKNEAAKILNYVKQYKADTATINNVELLFKYYVYFKILSKIVKSNGSKTIDEIVEDKVRKYKYNPIPNILIKDKYVEKFNAFISMTAYLQWFDDIVKKMNDHNKKIKNYLNNIRNN